MAFRKKTSYSKKRKTFRRKTYKRKSRKRFGNNKTVAKIQTSLIPRTLYVKLPCVYSFNMNIDAASGTNISPWTTYNINGNNITTPFIELDGVNIVNTLGAPIPMGLARYGQFYRSSRVLGAKCSVEFINTSDVYTPTVAITAYQGRVTLPPTSPDYSNNYERVNATDNNSFRAWPNTKYARLGIRDSGASTRRLSMYVKTKSILGVKDVRDEDGLSQTVDIAGAVGITDEPFLLDENNSWSFMLRSMVDNVSPASAINVDVKVVVRLLYYVELHDRKFEDQVVANYETEE
nr:MAG: putative capsid protein [Arizlama virus]